MILQVVMKRAAGLALTAALWGAASAGATEITSHWRILAGTSPLESVAAKDLADELNARFNLSLEPASNKTESAGSAIVIGTVEDNALVAKENARQPFSLNGQDQERYHLVRRGDKLFCVGATPKGAMDAAFRFADRQSLRVDGLDEAKSPIFRYRVAGHLMNQMPPPGWTEEDQARFYARHYINVIWGEKHGPCLSYEARKKYGLGLMVEMRFPSSATPEWWKDPVNSGAAFYLAKGGDHRVISPFDAAGRKFYLEGHKRLLQENPDIAILYGIFGDYNAIPGPESARISDGTPYGHTREETMLEILSIMKQAIGSRGIVPRAWMWHSLNHDQQAQEAFMRELPKHGFGPMYNEAGDSDCWAIKLDNFDSTALRTDANGKSAYGPDYISLVSAGGDCESMNPAIGMPLPRIAAYKLGRLAAAGVRDVALWWASGEGWVYQPNLEVLKELLWSDNAASFAQSKNFSASEPLLERIAERDFGHSLAPKVVDYWRRFDEALVTDRPLYKTADEATYGDPSKEGLRLYDWFQRMGVYTKWPFGSAILKPLTPRSLAGMKYGAWGDNDYTLANYKAVLDHLESAEAYLHSLIAQAPDSDARERLRSTERWTGLYRLLLISQYDHLRALEIMKQQAGEPLSSPKLRAALEPVANHSIANTETILAWATNFPPTFNINGAHRDVAFGQCDWAKESLKFQAKISETKKWTDSPRSALRPGAPPGAAKPSESRLQLPSRRSGTERPAA